MAVLDTSFLVALERGEAASQALYRNLQASDEPMTVPAAVWLEYLSGLTERARAQAAHHLRRAASFAPFDEHTADRAVLLQAHLRGIGKPMAWRDVQVAATAMQHHEPLITLDNDFDAILDLEVLHP